MDILVADHARKLLDQHGPHRVWAIVTAAALDAHLAVRAEQRDYWQDVLRALRQIAPRPGCSDLDIHRSARVLVQERGAEEARRHAMQRAAELEADLVGQDVWLRIADAVAGVT